MANSSIRIAAVLAALAFLLPAQENTNPPANGAKPVDAGGRGRNVAIGVVDLDKAIDQYPKAIAERERLQKMSQQLSERINGDTKRIDELRGQLALLKEGSDEREIKEGEITLAVKNRDGLATFLKAQFDRQIEKFEVAIYQDLEVAVDKVAKDRGVQIVLRVRPLGPRDDAGKESANALQGRLLGYNRRDVWYFTDEVDLTPALIKYLQVPLDSQKTEPGKSDTAPASKPAGNGNGGL